MTAYHTVAKPIHVPALTIGGSRFIADVYPVSSSEDALAKVNEVRSRAPDASHHCWAYRLYDSGQIRSSDDGEPGGSAGRPILAQIEGHGLFDVLVVITRYFGGTKLGVGGLIRAYGGTAGKALDHADLQEVHETEVLDIIFAYELTKAVEAVLRTHALHPVQTVFDADVRMSISVPTHQGLAVREALVQETSGRIGFPRE